MTKKIIKNNKKVSGLIRNRVQGIPVVKHGVPQPGITKKDFMRILEKASKPIEHDGESDSESSQT
jgi:hypothetical protein